MQQGSLLMLALAPGAVSAFGVAAASPLPLRATAVLGVAEGVSDGVRFALPQQQLPRRAVIQPENVRAGEPVGILGRGKNKNGNDVDPNEIPDLAAHPKRKVALLVEPTPFTHVSGYSNRFKEMLRFLKAGGDDAEVITPDDSPERPSNFLGMPITYVPGFRLIFYKQVQLTLDVGFRALNRLRESRPNLIHAVTPGFFVLPAILYARLLKIPLVISYHTHLPHYAGRYVKIPGLRQLCIKMAEWYLPAIFNFADLTLATSPQLAGQLTALGCKNVDVWRKGIDTDVFSPAYNASNAEMRSAMSDGQPQRPLLVHVGRLGSEKNIELIRGVLERIPEARLAIVGAGPHEPELKEHFKGTDTVFMGMLTGESLSRAYACGDVFVMPSESETLGFVVLEAMASQVPPVGAAAGGIPNLIKDGQNGFLFEPGNADEFAEKVRMLINDNDLRRRMGEAGRAETLKWNWRAATSVLRNLQYTRAERNFAERQRWWSRQWSWLPWKWGSSSGDEPSPQPLTA